MADRTPTRQLLVLVVLALVGSAAEAASLSLGSASCAPGGEVRIPVRIDDASDLLAADIALLYDPERLMAVGAEVAELGTGFEIAHTVRWGRITLSLARAAPLKSGQGDLATVLLRARDDAAPGKTAVSVVSARAFGADRQPRALGGEEGDGTVTVASSGGGGGGGGSCFLGALSR